MKLRFKINYHTQWGHNLYISGSLPELGNWEENKARPMNYLVDGWWELDLELENDPGKFAYKYLIRSEKGHAPLWEWGQNRELEYPAGSFPELEIQDYWRPAAKPENAWFSSAFTEVLMKRPEQSPPIAKIPAFGPLYRFQLYAPRVGRDFQLCIIGGHPKLGDWDEQKAVVLDDARYPLWEAAIDLPHLDKSLEYKYGIYDAKKKAIVYWESGDNRVLLPADRPEKRRLHVITDSTFRFHQADWKGAGVAIPVFSLRSEQSFGIGEFTDLKRMIDWASQVNLKLVQILPINDTTATHGWMDSYPYAAISVFALHPMYLHLPAMGTLKDPKQQARFEALGQSLNAQAEIDFLAVIAAKSEYFKLLYDQEKTRFLKSKAFQAFFSENEAWLVDYAVFSRLRDLYKTADFHQWPTFSKYDSAQIKAYAAADQAHYDDIAIHYFIQFHLDKQLAEAADYATDKGIVFKGDIPIGIYRHSVDAWVAPHLYHMNAQAGAPPDAFAVKGQNWRFPTYNWEVMAENGFAWWRNRLTHMARYFDAYRIDHILGFFRIWQIPGHAVEGLLGQFNPSMPFTTEVLHQWGLWFEEDRFTKPYIREHMLPSFFGDQTQAVKDEFLQDLGYGIWQFREGLGTQRAIEAYIDAKMGQSPDSKERLLHIREGLYSLASEVIFLPSIDGTGFDPRIALHHTYSYQELDEHTKSRLNELYNHYFYHRQDAFWRDQALVKLPAIQAATDMLVCGEDLGMVPDSVPGVMNELGILSLEIQRMPKDPKKEFAHPADAPYLSVVSPSTHDMATLRGWWEEDRALTQRFFNHTLGQQGEAPWFCEPWVAEMILNQHLHSPAMWTIFPLQDLLAIDGAIRRENPEDERINVPANSAHHWRYRMHLDLEELEKAEDFNRHLAELVKNSGRAEAY